MATNIEKVNVAISNKAFSEGRSITDEYNIKNNNLQVQLEKQRKAFNDAALELEERLSPELLKSANIMTYFIKLLPSVLDFFEKYGKTILSLGTAIGVYMGVVELVIFSQAKWTIADTIHYRLL